MRLFDLDKLELKAAEVREKKPVLEVATPVRDRVDWYAMSIAQAQQMFGIKFFSRRLGLEAEYAIARDRGRMDESWTMIKNMPKNSSLEYGKDPIKNKLVCRMLYLGEDTGFYVYRKEEKRQ